MFHILTNCFICSGLEGNVSFEQVVNHLEQSCRHLESLGDPLIYELTEHDEVCCSEMKIINHPIRHVELH